MTRFSAALSRAASSTRRHSTASRGSTGSSPCVTTRPELAREQASAEMLRHRGTQFDPRVVDALLALESGVLPAPHESDELLAAHTAMPSSAAAVAAP